MEEGRERVRKIFETAFFIGQWIFGFAAICLFFIFQSVYTEFSYFNEIIFAFSQFAMRNLTYLGDYIIPFFVMYDSIITLSIVIDIECVIIL